MDLKQEFKTIGVLGGMGAAASANFYQEIVKIAQEKYKASEDTDFPPMFIYNLPLSGFGETGFLDEDLVKSQLLEAVKKLESIGVDFIVIPCNTVHHFFNEMQQNIKIPILSILEVAAETIQKNSYKKVGILSSRSTKEYQLYENILNKKDVDTISTNEDEQEIVDKIIGNVIAGKQNMSDTALLQEIIARFKKEGAESVILGCTEIPLAISQKDSDVPLQSTISLLAEAGLVYSFNKN